MNPKHFTTIRHSLPAKMRLTIWPSVLHLKTGRFGELNMLAKKLWHADERLVALKELRVGWFRSSCIMLVLLLSFTPLRASWNGTIQHIPNIQAAHPNISCDWKAWQFFISQLFPQLIQHFEVEHVAKYTGTSTTLYNHSAILNSKCLPIHKICEDLPCFSKGLGPSWSSKVDELNDFLVILRWFTAKLARSSGHNGGHTKWISCLLWSRSFRSCGLWASDPRVATDFWWEEFSESFGEVCFETSGYFCCVCL